MWYAIYTKPRWEKKLLQGLQDKNIEAFLPLRKTLKQWSDRKKWVEEPLFSCYIFVNVNPQEYYQAINTYGAVRYITFEGKPALVPEQQINAVKIYLNQCDAITGTFEELAPGIEVEVIEGPMKGIRGEMHQWKNHRRVAIRIEAVGQEIMLNIPRNNLKVLSSGQQGIFTQETKK